MKHISALVALFTVAGLVSPAHAGTLPIITKCPPDAVLVGPTCVDTYEASVWQIPSTNTGLINKVKKGTVKPGDLTGGGATEISPNAGGGCGSPRFPSTFPANGQWTQRLYAASVPGVVPTACVSWFQAAQACRLSGKRLLTNLEWQDAAAGTPDPGGSPGAGDCNTKSSAAVNTGSRTNCKSSWGAFDMVGNVGEWVADWGPLSTFTCPGWGSFSDDVMCFAGADTTSSIGPEALVRGGDFTFDSGTAAGVFAVDPDVPWDDGSVFEGFRCAR